MKLSRHYHKKEMRVISLVHLSCDAAIDKVCFIFVISSLDNEKYMIYLFFIQRSTTNRHSFDLHLLKAYVQRLTFAAAQVWVDAIVLMCLLAAW